VQVFTVVKAMQQTTVSAESPVMTVKGSTTPVQVANSEFYVDPATGFFRMRTPSGSTGGARHLLQDVDPAARIASADFNLHSSGLMVSSNVFTQPSLLDSDMSGWDWTELDFNGSSGRHLLATTSATPAPTTVLPPVCDWASDDLFDISSCDIVSTTGTVSLSNKQAASAPHYFKCDSMQGTCQNFLFGTKVSIPMWANGFGDVTGDTAGRLCVSWLALCPARTLTLRFAVRRCLWELCPCLNFSVHSRYLERHA
jgi:hypothetical protein